MIYTITFNPSLDYVIQVDHFKPGIINKTKLEEILPGGKGINSFNCPIQSWTRKYSPRFYGRFYRGRN